MPEGRQLRLEPCRHCPTCPLGYRCQEGATEYGCENEFTPPGSGGRDIMHPLRPDLTERLWECKGLDIRIRLRTIQGPLPALPSYIPRVQPQAGFESPDCWAIAVPLDRVRPSGNVVSAAWMKAALRMPVETVMLVTCFERDEVLETLWRNRRRFVKAMARAGYDLVTVPNFSLWDGDTPLEHRYNIARSLRMFEMLVEAGVAAVPHVSWYLPRRDIDEWISVLRAWRGLPAFSIDVGTLKWQDDWEWGLRGLRRLFDGIGVDWEVLVNGLAANNRISQVARICGHIHVINGRPFQLAMSTHITIDELLTWPAPRTPRARMEVFAAEVQKMFAMVPPPPNSCGLRLPTRLVV